MTTIVVFSKNWVNINSKIKNEIAIDQDLSGKID